MTDYHNMVHAVYEVPVTRALVTIGRNVGTTPMADDVWARFVSVTRRLVTNARGTVVASNVGRTESEGWGAEDGAWFSVEVPTRNVDGLKADLRILANTYQQDAIGWFPLGAPEFLSDAAQERTWSAQDPTSAASLGLKGL